MAYENVSLMYGLRKCFIDVWPTEMFHRCDGPTEMFHRCMAYENVSSIIDGPTEMFHRCMAYENVSSMYGLRKCFIDVWPTEMFHRSLMVHENGS